MFFQISPTIHKKQKCVPQISDSRENESIVEVLSLAPFTPNPKIIFENVIVGTSQKRSLIIKNPLPQDIMLFIKKHNLNEFNLLLSWTEISIEKCSETLLEIEWCPTKIENSRQIFTLSDGKRINRDVAIIFKSQDPKPSKTTSTRSAKTKTKSPGKITVKTKKLTPKKKNKKEIKNQPNVQKNAPVVESQKKPFVRNYYNSGDYDNVNYILSNSEATYISRNKNPINHYPGIFDRESKENIIPRIKTELCETIAPNLIRDSTFSMSINSIENYTMKMESQNTFTIESVDKSPQFNDSLETSFKSPSRFKSPSTLFNKNASTPTLESLLNVESTPNSNYKSKSPVDLTFNIKNSMSNSLNNSMESMFSSSRRLYPLIEKNQESNNETYTKEDTCFRYSLRNDYNGEQITNGTFIRDISVETFETSSTIYQNKVDGSGIISQDPTIQKLYTPNKRCSTIQEDVELEEWSVGVGSVTCKSGVKKSAPMFPVYSQGNNKSWATQNACVFSLVDPFMVSQAYVDDDWFNQQEMRFVKWLNALLTPPKELNTKTEVDLSKIWQHCKNHDIPKAPSKEMMSYKYHSSVKLDNLRKQAEELYKTKSVKDVLQKICLAIDAGKLTIREDKDLHLNLKLKSEVMGLILSYNPLWLRIGLETIYNETIPLKSNSDSQGLANFILERFFKDPYLLKKYKSLYAPKYASDLKKFILKKFLILVYFLDQAKTKKLIKHDPCLFCKNAAEKESKLILTHFARETLAGVGDITKYLKSLGYIVTHVQSYINEFDYAVTNLGIDLRDGVRLARVMEILQMRDDLTCKLRVPAISRLQKVYNMQLVFKSLHLNGYEIQYDICPKDIVDGHKEKTFSFLWQLIYKFEAPLMVSSAITIQAWFRSLPVVLKRRKLQKIYEKRKRAVMVIQRWYKNHKLSTFYLMLAEKIRHIIEERKLEKSAMKIQSFFRMFMCRRVFLQKYHSIVRLQTYAKGWLARRKCEKKRTAIVMIQRIYRGYVCRNKFIILKKYATIVQRKFRANQLMRRKKGEFEMLKKATIAIQRRFKANLEMRKHKKSFTLMKNAAIKIQSFYKMYVARKQYLVNVKSIKLIQSRYRAYLAMKTSRNYYLVLQKATLSIQRRFRANLEMRVCKNEFVNKKNAVRKLQGFYRTYKLRKYFLELRNATLLIQRKYRSYKLMKDQKSSYMTIKHSTVLIQQYFRGYLQMKKCKTTFINLKVASIKIQNYYKMYKTRKQYLIIRKSAIVLQRRYRAQKEMLQVRSYYLNMKRSVIYIQQLFRANQLTKYMRNRYILLRQSAVKIQSYYRMYIVRKQFLELKDATIKIQRRFLAQKVMKKEIKNYDSIKKSAIICQRRWRARKMGIEQRSNYLTLKKATLVLQRHYKANKEMRTVRYKYEKLLSATLKIQQWYRSILCMRKERIRYKEMKFSVLVIERRYIAFKLMQDEKSRFNNMRKNAIRIQRWFRASLQMKIERDAYLKTKNAIIKIQKWYRASVLAKKTRVKYEHLKRVTLFIQSKIRAKKTMQLERSKYITQRNAIIRIQQWYRASKEMKKCYAYYQSVKLAVRSIENRYAARKAMKLERQSFETIKKSCVTIQQHYRAYILKTKSRKRFLEMKKAAVIIQRRFRAKQACQLERSKYLELMNATIYIQRKYRAMKQMRTNRDQFIRLRNAAVTIQVWYRARKLEIEREKLLHAALVVQRRYRANILAKQERQEFLKLKNSVIIIQRRFRAQIIMKKERETYLKLKKNCLLIQRKFRAIILMRKVRYDFKNLRNATLMIQRRYRASKAMKSQFMYYKSLRDAVLLLQQKFRANKLARIQRSQFCHLKNATLLIQRRYRAKISGTYYRNKYLRIKKSVLIIQSWYRSQKEMKGAVMRYQKMRQAACVIQQRYRAKIIGNAARRRFLKIKESARIIQTRYRAYLQMKNERKIFLEKYNAVTRLQKYIRVYLVRKKLRSLLKPEAIEERRKLRTQFSAAVRIQSTWRGYSSRKSNSKLIAVLKQKKHILKQQKNATYGRTLAQRYEMAMMCMANENSSLLMIIKALEDLDFISRHCRDSCIRLSLLLSNQLYIIISSAARSLPDMSACNMASLILINFCKCPQTKQNSFKPEYLDDIMNVLLHWCDKEAPLFSTLCTLLWLFAHEEEWRKVILNIPNVLQRFEKIETLVHRKQNMVIKQKKVVTSIFGPVANSKMPTRKANWGLDYDRPNTFTNAPFALLNLKKALNIL